MWLNNSNNNNEQKNVIIMHLMLTDLFIFITTLLILCRSVINFSILYIKKLFSKCYKKITKDSKFYFYVV